MKKTLFFLLAVAIGMIPVLLAAEVALYFLPVCEDFRALPVNESNPVLRFMPDRDVTWSKFPTFEMVNSFHVNNFGFVNDADYAPLADGPLVAVIGDSFIEAVMLPFRETAHGLLAEALAGGARVYSFASSGSQLSQYLAYGQWVAETFSPDKMIFLVIGNDFDESLAEYRGEPPFHYFVPGEDGELTLTRTDWSPSLAYRIARRSRLALYLLNNAGIRTLPRRLRDRLRPPRDQGGGPLYAGHTAAAWDEKRLRSSRRAVDYFLEELPRRTGLDAADILIAVSGLNGEIYGLEAGAPFGESYFGLMRDYLMEGAKARGFPIVDLQGYFARAFEKDPRPFEFERDGHWNSRGHETFFQALYNSGFVDEYRL